MWDGTSRSLVIANGGFLSLLALAMAREAVTAAGGSGMKPIAYLPSLGGATATVKRDAAIRQADLFDAELVEAPVPSQAASAVGEAQTRLLVAAAYAATARQAALVVWPVRAGAGDEVDVTQAARALDRALLLTRLVALDADEHHQPAIRIEAPFADLSDRQVADLALDLDLPVRECWWWRDGYIDRLNRMGAEHARADAALRPAEAEGWDEFKRWMTALRAAGWAAATEART
ncbi:MAG: hypothetical protein FJ255_08450 [Phycisphaerae bacterium]|nr:hypothetical protein [Phycisphaerae bacterium]